MIYSPHFMEDISIHEEMYRTIVKVHYIVTLIVRAAAY